MTNEINFEYPISVIAGKNSVGKSTILAMAACAYHNKKSGFKLPERKIPYYTFQDFLSQSKEEISPEGIIIRYKILHNHWTKSSSFPEGKGAGWQTRKKQVGGSWNNYSKRVHRNVVYYGINRIVPHSEKSVYKSYNNYFKKHDGLGWEQEVKNTVGKILNKNYDDFWYKDHAKYRLPLVKSGRNVYSGFNMGAGENALLEIFSTIYSCPLGTLFLIDEIELGLHEEAQRRFVNELKKLCFSRGIQIICTTHSFNIMASVPPEARFFVENFNGNTVITPRISPLYASGKLSGTNSNELDIYVEDSIAKSLLELALSTKLRTRINIIPIGSSSAVARQLAAHYKNLKKGDCIAILDGDQNTKKVHICNEFLKSLESIDNTEEATVWVNLRLNFLPGDTWPEKWILSELKKYEKTDLLSALALMEMLFRTYTKKGAKDILNGDQEAGSRFCYR